MRKNRRSLSENEGKTWTTAQKTTNTMTTAEILTKILDLHRIVTLGPPILWEGVQPRCEKFPDRHERFTATRLRSAVSALQCGQLLGLKLSPTETTIRACAYVCSGRKMQTWYLAKLEVQRDEMWTGAKFSCPCTAALTMFCHHAVAILLSFILIHALPVDRPKWCQFPGCLPKPSSKNTTENFKRRHLNQPYNEPNAQKLLYLLTLPPPDHLGTVGVREDLRKYNDRQSLDFIYAAKPKKNQNLPRGSYHTKSWPKALLISLNSAPFDPIVPSNQPTQETPSVPAIFTSSVEKRPRICRKCKKSFKGHRRGYPCPDTPPSPQNTLPPPSETPLSPPENQPPHPETPLSPPDASAPPTAPAPPARKRLIRFDFNSPRITRSQRRLE